MKTKRLIFSQGPAPADFTMKLGVTTRRSTLTCSRSNEPATWAELVWYEDLGLCGPGEGYPAHRAGQDKHRRADPGQPSSAAFSRRTASAPPPCSASGRRLQIPGDAGEHQVPKDVRRALTTAYGGTNWTVMTALSKTLDD